MSDPPAGSFIRLLSALALFLVVGGPAVYFMWRELSELLYGRFGDVQLAILVPAAIVFFGLLILLATYVRRLAPAGWEKEGA